MRGVLWIRLAFATFLVVAMSVVVSYRTHDAAPSNAEDGLSESGPVSGTHDHTCAEPAARLQGRWVCDTPEGRMSSRWPLDAAPSDQQVRRAMQFASQVQRNAQQYADFEDAERAGYTYGILAETRQATEGTGYAAEVDSAVAQGAVEHVVNPVLITDGIALEAGKPDSLIYAQRGDKRILVGAMFVAPFGVDGPQVGGPATVWHTHRTGEMSCYVGDLPTGFVPYRKGDRRGSPTGVCARGKARRESPQMLHVWFDNTSPKETFAADMAPEGIQSVFDRAPSDGDD